MQSKMILWGLCFMLFAYRGAQGKFHQRAALMQALETDGGEDLVEVLADYLKRTEARQQSLEEQLSELKSAKASASEVATLKNKVAAKASASEVATLKTKVTSLEARKNIRCEVGWVTFTSRGPSKMTKTFSAAFSVTPSLILAVDDVTTEKGDLSDIWFGYTPGPSSFKYWRGNSKSPFISAYYMACGH